MEKNTTFISFIQNLLEQGDIALQNKFKLISKTEEKEAISFLADFYKRIQINQPYQGIPFNKDAALWGAKLMYFTAQFFLIRKHKKGELKKYLENYNKALTPDVLASADIALKFLPQLYELFLNQDSEDIILPLLEEILKTFQYSAIGSIIKLDKERELLCWDDECYKQLFIDRITEKRDYNLSNHPKITEALDIEVGNHKENLFCNT